MPAPKPPEKVEEMFFQTVSFSRPSNLETQRTIRVTNGTPDDKNIRIITVTMPSKHRECHGNLIVENRKIKCDRCSLELNQGAASVQKYHSVKTITFFDVIKAERPGKMVYKSNGSSMYGSSVPMTDEQMFHYYFPEVKDFTTITKKDVEAIIGPSAMNDRSRP